MGKGLIIGCICSFQLGAILSFRKNLACLKVYLVVTNEWTLLSSSR